MSARPIQRLAFVTDARTFGGAERYVVDVACAAHRSGIEPQIIWLPAAEADDAVLAPARAAEIPLTIKRETSRTIGLMRAFRRALAETRPDALIVNATGRPGFWLTCWMGRHAGVPVAWVHHMVEQRDPRRIPPRWMGGTMEGPQWWRVPQALRHRLAAAAATAVVASSDADRERIARLQGVNRAKIVVIPPGVDCARLRWNAVIRTRTRRAWGIADAEAAPTVIGTAARLVRRKGIELLIEAVAILQSRGVRVLAVIAGEGPDKCWFVEEARRRNVAEVVRFAGFVEDMPAFHNGLDVFALASDTESFGLALTEAMACERAAVSTPTAGGRQQVRHLESGWLLDGFSAAELAHALEVLHRDPRLRQRLGERARLGVIERFNIEGTLQGLLGLLRRGMGAPANRRALRTFRASQLLS